MCAPTQLFVCMCVCVGLDKAAPFLCRWPYCHMDFTTHIALPREALTIKIVKQRVLRLRQWHRRRLSSTSTGTHATATTAACIHVYMVQLGHEA